MGYDDLMKIILALLVLTTNAQADTPNVFNKDEMSSESIWVAINSCEEVFVKQSPQVKANVRWSYCSCMIDAVRSKQDKPEEFAKFCLQQANNRYGAK